MHFENTSLSSGLFHTHRKGENVFQLACRPGSVEILNKMILDLTLPIVRGAGPSAARNVRQYLQESIVYLFRVPVRKKKLQLPGTCTKPRKHLQDFSEYAWFACVYFSIVHLFCLWLKAHLDCHTHRPTFEICVVLLSCWYIDLKCWPAEGPDNQNKFKYNFIKHSLQISWRHIW